MTFKACSDTSTPRVGARSSTASFLSRTWASRPSGLPRRIATEKSSFECQTRQAVDLVGASDPGLVRFVFPSTSRRSLPSS